MQAFRTIFMLSVAIAVAASQTTNYPTEEPSTTEVVTEPPSSEPPSTEPPTQTTRPTSTTGSGNTTTTPTTSPPDYLTCDPGDDEVCPLECPPDAANGTATYLPFPYDCTKYCECTNEDARCIKCSPGTVWDQELLTCNHDQVITCVTVTTARTTPTTTTPTTTTPTTTTPTTTTTTTTEPSTTVDLGDPINWICPEGYEGRMGHPYNCSYFYICDPGRRPCLFECHDNLFYNPVTMDCDWPFNVPTCVDGTPPPPTSTTPRSNYRNAIRQHSSEKRSFFSFFSIFQETTTEGSTNPCEEPTLAEKYYRIE